jgi:signal transduction histidine kinase
LEVTGDLPEQSMDPRQRHELLLAFKEALNNVAQHSQATEVRLQIGLEKSELFLVVADNGRGLGPAANGTTTGMDGLANMRQRLKQAGGRCDISSEPGRGTTIRFFLPLK